MPTTLFQSNRAALAAAADNVDSAAGVIRSVAVITRGPALGHGMMIDATTLAQVKASAESYSGGLKVKMTHQGDAGDIVGYLTNFAIAGDKLTADFHLLRTAPQREYVLEIASRIPDSFGMSIAFSGQAEEIGGVRYARCSEIYSCDLVSEPAANPDGLFARRFDTWQSSKGNSPEETSNPLMETELLKKIGEMIDAKLTAHTAAFDAKISALSDAHKATLSKIEDVSKLSNEAGEKIVAAALKEFSKTLGAPAGAAAAPSAPVTPTPVKTFEELVREHPKYATSKMSAISETISAHGQAHREYLARVQAGKDVILF